MKQAVQEIIDKILSFNYEELENWIHSRLHGNDRYFPMYDGYEMNLAVFLGDVFERIKSENFRENFIEILSDLVYKLDRIRANDEIEKNKDYIYELLTLCRRIRRINNKDILFKIARSGRLKPYNLRDTDLHMVLLTTLQVFRIGGNHRFWSDQMKDGSNKFYTNAAFYALLKHGYSPDILFKHIKIFIDRFKDDVLLDFGIKAMFEYHEPQEIYRRFKKLKTKLSREQKDAVNNAFSKAGYTIPYKRFPGLDIPLVYGPIAAGASMVGEKTSDEERKKYLLKKATEIFRQMGFLVDTDYREAGQAVALFIKKKKPFVDKYDCYVCECSNDERKVKKNEIQLLVTLRKLVRMELEERKGDCTGCDAIYIALMGFTKGAIELATEKGIILKTITELEAELTELNGA